MVERMVAQEDEFNGIMDFMTEGDDDLGPPGSAAQQDLPNDDDEDVADAARFEDQLRRARNGGVALPPAPNVTIDTDTGLATWHRPSGNSITLKPAQYKYYELLKNAGKKQLLTFLSGQVTAALKRCLAHEPYRTVESMTLAHTGWRGKINAHRAAHTVLGIRRTGSRRDCLERKGRTAHRRSHGAPSLRSERSIRTISTRQYGERGGFRSFHTTRSRRHYNHRR